MNTFLQFFTESARGEPREKTQEFKDKIVKYKKENPGVSLDDISKIFGAVRETIRTILNKNWPEWKKYSTTTVGRKPGGRPRYDQEIQDKIVKYKKENPIATLEDIRKIFKVGRNTVNQILSKNWPEWKKHSKVRVGSKPKFNQEFQDKIVKYTKQNPSASLEDIGRIFNTSISTIYRIINKNWPEWKKHSKVKAGRPVKPGSSVGSNIKSDNNTKPKIFTDVQSELDYYKSLIIKLEKEIEDKKAKGEDTSVGKIAAEFNVPREVVHIAKHGADKNTDDSDRKEDYDYIGKINDRKIYLNKLRPVIERMGKSINVLGLPHNYKFEKDLLNTFNLDKINSYGFNLKNNKTKQIDYARLIYKESNHKIFPNINYNNINKALISPDIFNSFKKLTPHGFYGGGFIDKTEIPREGFDIIDLDFKQFPGTTPSMRPDKTTNPWFAPVLAAKNYLKTGGLVMVTYVVNSYRQQKKGGKEPTFLTMLKNPNNNMLKYKNVYTVNDKEFILTPYNIPDDSKQGWVDDGYNDEELQKYYSSSTEIANIYTNNIIYFASVQGVKLKPQHVNIYPGSIGYFMYRGVFLKQ